MSFTNYYYNKNISLSLFFLCTLLNIFWQENKLKRNNKKLFEWPTGLMPLY